MIISLEIFYCAYKYEIEIKLTFLGRLKIFTLDVCSSANYQTVIYITYAVGYILQREIFNLKHDRETGVF
jgi:hypothetical protein